MTDAEKAELVIRYKDVSDMPPRQLFMATEAQRRKHVEDLYPGYSWTDGESVLWNWIDAVAHEAGVDHETARRVCANASDPIWGGPNYQTVGKWVFFIA